MNPKCYSQFLCTAFVVATTAGCASYRVSSNVESAPTAWTAPASQVLLAEDTLPGRKYSELGPIEVSVKKLTVFDKDTTKAQADQALVEKARSIGADADAVINIKYSSGIGFTTWGYIDAKGTGVKLMP